MSARACICTVISRSYASFAQVLVDSIRAHHPASELDVLVCVVDGHAGEAPAAAIGVDARELLTGGGRDLLDLLDRYGRQSLVVAAKAAMLELALDRGYERAVFLDADTLALDRLDPLLDDRAGEIVLSPHVLAPLAPDAYVTGDTGREFERILLLSGVFNGGCISLADGPNSRAMLRWLIDRLRTHCRHDVANGLHYDQTWLDLVPGMFDGVQVLRDPSINVAYWNLPERAVTRDEHGTWLAAGQPLRLFHFSGFDPRRPDVPSRYRPSMTMHDIEAVAPLLADYAARLVKAGVLDSIEQPSGIDATRERLLTRERAATGAAS